jgi:inhibitor of KinA sporulation pathway (predicted exonuclease)
MEFFQSQDSEGSSLGSHIVFFDIEWTSWEGAMANNFSESWQHREIIQIGAVRLDPIDSFCEVAAFNQYVVPQVNSVLSDYIVELTGITQSKIELDGIPFNKALNLFADFTGNWCLPTYSWGHDWTVIKESCELYKVPIPDGICNNMHNLYKNFLSAGLDVSGVTSGKLHSHFGLSLSSRAHNALHDVRSMAAVVAHLISADNHQFEKLL